MPWTHRWIGNPLISFTIRRMFRVPLRDCYCGLRLLTREAHRRLHLNAASMEFALEMIVQGALVGMRFAQVPITLHVDGRDRAPHLHTVRDGYGSFRFLFQHAPIAVYSVPGIVIALAGTALLAREAWLELHGATSFNAAAAGTALLLIGWQLGVFGIIARVFIAGFLGGQADTSLRRFFRFFRLESAFVGAIALQVAGLLLIVAFRHSYALFQLGLAMSVIAVGTFVGALVVSLIGRAMPDQLFADKTPASTSRSLPEADDGTRQNVKHSLATQAALSRASAYNAWLVDSLRGAWEGSARVIDLGCSIGNVTHVVADRLGAGATVVGVEIIPEAARRFEERFAERPDLRVVCADFAQASPDLDTLEPFHAAVCFNVLEHIEDDVAALQAIAGRLEPSGRLGLLVPGGGDRLYGTLDLLDRHYRRYTPARLRVRLEAAGFEVVSIRRVNMVGAVLWFLKGRVLRSQRFDDREVAAFDRLVPALRWLDSALGPPFGQSLAAVARLPEATPKASGL
jgi:SAM-dependent methyltransferase